jgi:hypothetical protein
MFLAKVLPASLLGVLTATLKTRPNSISPLTQLTNYTTVKPSRQVHVLPVCNMTVTSLWKCNELIVAQQELLRYYGNAM